VFEGNIVRGRPGDWRGTRGVGIDVEDPDPGLLVSQNFVHGHNIGIDVTGGGRSAIVSNVVGPNRIGLRVDRLGRMDLSGNEDCQNFWPLQVRREPRPDEILVRCGSSGMPRPAGPTTAIIDTDETEER
jgi:hypothetical protein